MTLHKRGKIVRNRRKNRLFICLSVLAALGLLTIAAFYRGIVITSYETDTTKVGAKESIHLVLLTDLHSYIYEPDQKPLIEKVKNLQPDVIFLSGDMADDRNPYKGLDMLLTGIAELAPCFYVSGSHDYWSGEIDKIKSSVTARGVTVLEGNTAEISIRGQKLFISGIDDPSMAVKTAGEGEYEAYRRALQPFTTIDKSQYNILVAHRPDFYNEYSQLGFDLVVSGHTHGGQVRIPFILNGLYAPNQGYYPKYAGGLYDIGAMKLLVSRGLSFYPELPRIFNPPEIVLLELNGAQEDKT